MRLAVRPYLTTGVAIIGASVLIANPATLPSLELPSIQQIAASAPRLPNPGDALNAPLAGLLDLLPGGWTATAQTSSPAADALIAAIVVAGSTQVGVTINTPVEILAAAQAIAENPDQLQEALTKLSDQALVSVALIALTLRGVLTPLGTYLGSLATGAVDVVLTAVGTIIKGLGGALPAPVMAAATQQTDTLFATTPAQDSIAANIAGGTALTKLLVNAPVYILDAAKTVAANPTQLPVALATLSTQLQGGVVDLAKALAGIAPTVGPYLGQLATSAVQVVLTAVSGILPSTTVAAPAQAKAANLAAPAVTALRPRLPEPPAVTRDALEPGQRRLGRAPVAITHRINQTVDAVTAIIGNGRTHGRSAGGDDGSPTATARPARRTPVRDAVIKARGDITKVVSGVSDRVKNALSRRGTDGDADGDGGAAP
jgi:hypothetical protein